MFNPFTDETEDENERDPFGRVMPKQEPDPVIQNMTNPTELSESVGETGKNERPDVAKVETMLGKANTLDLKKTDGPTGYWGERTREATRDFQKKNNLKVDGQINPDGETVKKLGEVTGSAPSPVQKPKQLEVPQGKPEQISIGIWPKGDGVPSRQEEQKKPDNAELNNTATDDETDADDDLGRIRDHKAEIIKGLIEGGVDPEGARTFVNMLPDHQSDPLARSTTINALRAISGFLMKQTGVNIPKPEHFGGGSRDGAKNR